MLAASAGWSLESSVEQDISDQPGPVAQFQTNRFQRQLRDPGAGTHCRSALASLRFDEQTGPRQQVWRETELRGGLPRSITTTWSRISVPAQVSTHRRMPRCGLRWVATVLPRIEEGLWPVARVRIGALRALSVPVAENSPDYIPPGAAK